MLRYSISRSFSALIFHERRHENVTGTPRGVIAPTSLERSVEGGVRRPGFFTGVTTCLTNYRLVVLIMLSGPWAGREPTVASGAPGSIGPAGPLMIVGAA